MRRPTWIPLSLLIVLWAVPSFAQDSPFDVRRDAPPAPAAQQPSAATPQSPEMWLYERERERYESPKMAVRRKAELKGMQRAARLASQKWYGINNSRPYVTSTPMLGGYQSAFWGSNTYDPNRWRVYPPYVVLHPNADRY